MKNTCLILSIILLNSFLANAQWSNRYTKVDGFGHHVYLEGYELPVLNSGPTDAAPSPMNDEIAFAAKGYLWLMNLETQEAKRITSSPFVDSSPNWSPDGDKIVFVRDNSLNTQIVSLDLNTLKETILVSTEALELNPIFSKDGNKVFYSSARNGSLDLWEINLKTLQNKVITTEKSLERLPVPTIDGKSIVYLHKEGFSYDAIKVLDVEKGTSTPLIEENFTSQASFSLAPDDKTLVYTWPNGDDYELNILNIEIPKSRMLLTKSEGLPLTPKFSADGLSIYYSENNTNEVSELKNISVYGGSPKVIPIKKWNWGEETGKLKITSRVDGKVEPVRMSITNNTGHPVIPDNTRVHSEGQNGIIFFYSPGEIEIEVPLEKLNITVTRGFSTEAKTISIKFDKSFTETEINLDRIWNARENGWYAADNHFHLNYGGTYQLEPKDILLDMKAEEIDVAFPLVANLGNRFLEEELFDFSYESDYIISIGQEIRSHFLGHLNLIGTEELYWPWVWGPYYDIYEADDRQNAQPLDFARDKGGLGGYVHPVSERDPFAKPGSSSVPVALVADSVLGHTDILEVGCLWTDEIGTSALWHELLNLGIPVALSAGSDVMNNLHRTMAIGATRVYVKPQDDFTLDSFLKALKNGRSFVSNGPQVLFTVEDKEVGDVVQSKNKKAKWELTVHSPVAYDKVEIFVNGEVVWSKKSKKGNNQTYKGTLDIPKGGWVTARVSGTTSEWPMMDSFIFAESSPIWFGEIGSTTPTSKASAAQKLLNILKDSIIDLNEGYGENYTPELDAHFAKAQEKLINIIKSTDRLKTKG
jgi:TolB protein